MASNTQFWVTPDELQRRIGTLDSPIIKDVRRRDVFDAADCVVAGSSWGDHREAQQWGRDLPVGADVVVYCVHGHQVSQSAVAALRAMGHKASCLRGGIAEFVEAQGTTLNNWRQLEPGGVPSRWVTRTGPNAGRLACSWLVKRFLDPHAQFYFVEADQVMAVAEELGAVAFDVDAAALSSSDASSSFDAFVGHFQIRDDALAHLAHVVRGADTGPADLQPECAGLRALVIGVACADADDNDALDHAMRLFDALYAWSRERLTETSGSVQDRGTPTSRDS